MSRLTKSNWRWIGAAIASGVVALLLVVGAVQAALEQSTVCEQHTEQHQAETDTFAAAEGEDAGAGEHETKAAEHQPHFCYRGHTAEEWIGILTALLAGFTWALAMATAALWLDARFNGEKQAKAARIALQISRRQLNASQDAYSRDLRAYLFVESITLEGLKLDVLPIVELRAKNAGKTPALDTKIQQHVRLRPLSFDFSAEPAPNQSQMIVGPGHVSSSKGPLGAKLKKEEIDAINSGAATIFIFGTITYRDVFGAERWTKFRFKLQEGPISDGILIACDSGNEMN